MDDQVQKRVLDLMRQYDRQDRLLSSGFLDLNAQAQAQALLRQHASAALFCGGYEQAERRMLVLLPSYLDASEFEQSALMGALKITAPFAAKTLSHRDYLGALLGLGIKRECVGDILVEQDKAMVVLSASMLDFVADNLFQVGRANVQTQPIALSELVPVMRSEKQIRCTVPQLRLDCVAAAAFSLSRSRMSEIIAQGDVCVNWQPCQHRERLLCEGDTISIRKLGRAQLMAIGGSSRKERIFIDLVRFI